MQISGVYSNHPEIFLPVRFNYGLDAQELNVVLGEVRRPADKKRDSHNLGKTTLLNLIDFLMLKGVSPGNFLIKHQERFKPFVFYIEIALNSGDFATVRRSVATPTKIALKRHPEGRQNYAEEDETAWDHVDVAIEEAIKLLDAWLDLRVLKPYDYRKAITYFLRAQGDWTDELQLEKFQMGRDLHWKPFVAHLFGFNANSVQRKYELDDEIAGLRHRQAEHQAEVQFKEDDLPALVARIAVARQHVGVIEKELDSFSFDSEERRMVQELIDVIETEIAQLNNDIYDSRYDVRQIDSALEHKDRFDLKQVEEIFGEANLHFPTQIKRKYEDLVKFNRQVTHDRNTALRARKKELQSRISDLQRRKLFLDAERESRLAVIRSTDSFDKFKALQRELSKQQANIVYLEEQRNKLERVAEIATQVRELERDRGRVVDEVKTMVTKKNPVFERFARIFNQYCQRVFSQEWIFFFYVNSSGNLDYTIGLGFSGQSGVLSSQGEGTSYKKLVCALFDLALLEVYKDAPFFHFVFHDGVLEGLDNGKKEALLELIHEQIADDKTQYILTLIEADLPRGTDGNLIHFAESEVVLRLHDEGTGGRLFRMGEF
jgi:uncharacterized protein YydD (DUF2326 family)